MNRPLCAICTGDIPTFLLSDKDIQAEREYCRERHEKMRDWYCSRKCFQVSRDGSHKATQSRLSRVVAPQSDVQGVLGTQGAKPAK